MNTFSFLSGKIPKNVGTTLCHKINTHLIFTKPKPPQIVQGWLSSSPFISVMVNTSAELWAIRGMFFPKQESWWLRKAKPPAGMLEQKSRNHKRGVLSTGQSQRRVSMSHRKISRANSLPWSLGKLNLLHSFPAQEHEQGKKRLLIDDAMYMLLAHAKPTLGRRELYFPVLHFVSSEILLCSLPGWVLQWQDSSLPLQKFACPKQN